MCLQLWIKDQLAKKVDLSHPAIAQIGEHFLIDVLCLQLDLTGFNSEQERNQR